MTTSSEPDQPKDTHASKLFLETSTPTSASPYPSPSSAFYPPPIPASHEFANKLASNKRYRGIGSLVTSGLNSSSSNTNSSSNAGASPSASTNGIGINALLSASTSEPSSRRASDAFLSPVSGGGTASRRGSETLKTMGHGSAPGSRRQSRDANATSEKRWSGRSLKDGKEYLAESVEEPSISPVKPAPCPVATENTASSNGPIIPTSESSLHQPPPESSVEGSEYSQTASSQPSSSPTNRRISLTPLTPSRPAPPSPAPSRRPSLARRGSSRYSSASRDGEQRAEKAARRQSNLSMTFTMLATEQSATEAAKSEDMKDAKEEEEKDEEEGVLGWKPIIVRDFAFPEDDARFSKVPVGLLPLHLRPSQSPSHSGEDVDEYEDEDESWHEDEESELTPLPSNTYANANGGDEVYQEDAPLRSGIYRALFAFEAEGTAEMSLSEGEFVHVVGNGGVGWAVVERGWKPSKSFLRQAGLGESDDDRNIGKRDSMGENGIAESGSGALGAAGQALVPESYLEVWELDEWIEQDQDDLP